MSRNFAELIAWAALGLAASSLAAAPPRPFRSEKACAPLTLADLETALGLEGGRALIGMEVPFVKDAEHDHAGSLFNCQGTVGGRYVSLTFGARPVTAEARKLADEKLAKTQDALRAKGYTIRTAEGGGIGCWTMAAPAGDTSDAATFATTCNGVKGADSFSITVSARNADDLVPMAKVRALAGAVASKLP
jgi:hypothetical protein